MAIRIDVATLFPALCEAVLQESIVGRARKKGLLDIRCHNIRDYTQDKHRRVDDSPYGGGMGMVMQAQPIYDCFRAVTADLTASGKRTHVVYLSPKGKVFTQEKAVELSRRENLFFLCGHYEGVDQRVLDSLVQEEISIGDYVLTGGELPALVVIDALARMVDGVLPSPECFQEESHYSGLLEYPHYTKPEIWRDMRVPPVLLSGHHQKIEEWRQALSVKITKERRPDFLIKE